VLVAHSFGGAELNAIAVQRPRTARALVYLDGGFDFAELYADSAWMHVPIPRPPAPVGSDGTPAAASAYAALMTGPGYPEAEVRAQDAWGARLRTALAIYGVPRTVEEKYPWAARAPRERERFRREVPGGRVVEIPGGRHYVYLTHPREVAAAIRCFAR